MAPRRGSTGTTRPASTFSRYEMVTELFRSELGVLWAARTVAGARRNEVVMVRRVPARSAALSGAIAKLRAAAEWAQQLSHDSILGLLDVVEGEVELGIVSAYLPGDTMRSLLRLASVQRLAGRKGAPIPPAVALHVAIDLLDGIAFLERHAAHRKDVPGYLWGGLGPDGIMLGADGHARLLEPAVSGAAARSQPWARHPRRAAYAAPEMLTRRRRIDSRADLFTVGVLLWEMLLNRPLFSGSSYEAIAQNVCAGPIPRADGVRPGGAEIGSELADVLEQALQRDPNARFPSAVAMADAIWEAGHSIAKTKRVVAMLNELTGGTVGRQRERLEEAIRAADERDPTIPAERFPKPRRRARWVAAHGEGAPLPRPQHKPKAVRHGERLPASSGQGSRLLQAEASAAEPGAHHRHELEWSEEPTLSPEAEAPMSSSRAPTLPPSKGPSSNPRSSKRQRHGQNHSPGPVHRWPIPSATHRRDRRRPKSGPARRVALPRYTWGCDAPFEDAEVYELSAPATPGSTMPSPSEQSRIRELSRELGLPLVVPDRSQVANDRPPPCGVEMAADGPDEEELCAEAGNELGPPAVLARMRPRLGALAPLAEQAMVPDERPTRLVESLAQPAPAAMADPALGPAALDAQGRAIKVATHVRRTGGRAPRSSGTLEPTISHLTLEQAAEIAETVPTSESLFARMGRWCYRKPKVAGVVSAAAVAGLIASAGFSSLGDGQTAPSSPAVRTGVAEPAPPAPVRDLPEEACSGPDATADGCPSSDSAAEHSAEVEESPPAPDAGTAEQPEAESKPKRSKRRRRPARRTKRPARPFVPKDI